MTTPSLDKEGGGRGHGRDGRCRGKDEQDSISTGGMVRPETGPGRNTCRVADPRGIHTPSLTQCSPAHSEYKAEPGLASRRHISHTHSLQSPRCKQPAFECEEREVSHPILDVGQLPEPV
jgi:hypothetical protein